MSRRFVAIALAVAVMVSFLFVGAGPVAAHLGGTDTGVSGHCSNGDNGGGGSVGVHENGSVNAVDGEEARSIADGVTHFAQQIPDDQECGGEDDQSYDYVEAHVGNPDGGQRVHVCYSQDTSDSNRPINANTSDACHI